MIGQRSFPHSHSLFLLGTALTALAVIVAALLLGRAIAPGTVKVAEPVAVIENYTSERAHIAEGERWNGLAQLYSQRVSQAEAARWQGLAGIYQQKPAPVVADGLRWTGAAQVYFFQRGRAADAMRWASLAETYARP